MAAQTVKIADIAIPEIRSNAVYSPEKYQELKLSIAQAGIQFRPTIRRMPDGKYEVVDGRHRIQVWKELGHEDIEAEVEQLTDEQAFVKHITANHHRGENDPVGLARVIRKLRDGGKTLDDIGKLIGYSGTQTAQYLQLAYLPDVYQAAVSQGKLKLAHIKEAIRLEKPIEIDAALTYTLQMGWTADVLHHYVQNRVNELETINSHIDSTQAGMILPPLPNPQLAQYRTCLVCGAQGQAHEMFYPALGKECHDTLKYLISIEKNPYAALQSLISDLQNMQGELELKDQKIKELSDRIIDLSLRLMPGPQPNQTQQYYAPRPTPAGAPTPDIQSRELIQWPSLNTP
jgi:ParB/RepB/Spo0J family partition protein